LQNELSCGVLSDVTETIIQDTGQTRSNVWQVCLYLRVRLFYCGVK